MLLYKNRYGILCIIYLNFILAVSAAFQNKTENWIMTEPGKTKVYFVYPYLRIVYPGCCMKRGNVHIWPDQWIKRLKDAGLIRKAWHSTYSGEIKGDITSE